jgi:hypothetical protein
MVTKAQRSHGARAELNSMFDLEIVDGGTPLEHPPYSPDLAPCDFWTPLHPWLSCNSISTFCMAEECVH